MTKTLDLDQLDRFTRHTVTAWLIGVPLPGERLMIARYHAPWLIVDFDGTITERTPPDVDWFTRTS